MRFGGGVRVGRREGRMPENNVKMKQKWGVLRSKAYMEKFWGNSCCFTEVQALILEQFTLLSVSRLKVPSFLCL
ncbi:hypothetical protein TSUD_327840 [Trifolium subterraneum]|uniref:Uncharacterized protein n=1 Tax=Trifolium subterraneum TaxID=3900 RepID=A0A2Z6M1P4_TRISU|nr:hypothetical protein TSUD_327840 [Trifolium subterraneum]